MAVKTFAAGEVLTASDTNTYLNNGGLVYITEQAVTSGATLSFNNVFTSTYENYRILFYEFQPATAGNSLRLRMRAGGTDASTNDYYYAFNGLYVDGSTANNFSSAASSIDIGLYNSANTIAINYAAVDVFGPARTVRTFMNVNSSLYNAQFGCRNGIAEHNLTNAYDGFTVFPLAGNISNLRIKIYGYRQA